MAMHDREHGKAGCGYAQPLSDIDVENPKDAQPRHKHVPPDRQKEYGFRFRLRRARSSCQGRTRVWGASTLAHIVRRYNYAHAIDDNRALFHEKAEWIGGKPSVLMMEAAA